MMQPDKKDKAAPRGSFGRGDDQDRLSDALVGPGRGLRRTDLEARRNGGGETSSKGGVLGKKLELLSRDSKDNADEAVRLARELIIKTMSISFPAH
jgi:hypothetical protein